MADTTHIHNYYGVDEILDAFREEWDFDDIFDFFYDRIGDGAGNIDSSKLNGCPEFTIISEDGDERCDYYEENRYTLRLPSRKDADEFAYLVGGKVSSDGTRDTGAKVFRITYRNEVYISADSAEEAQAKFHSMTREELDKLSYYVEQVSCEEQK